MIESRYLTVAGIRTHYLEAGEGPILLLIHGGGAGADARGNWSGCLPLYAEHFRVIALDLPGFGHSDKPDPAVFDYGQGSRNRHLVAFIEALDAGPVRLIGNSMGGATALGAAMLRPDLVLKLVLMGSAGLAISSPDPEVGAALSGYDFTVEGMRRIVECLVGPTYPVDDEMLAYRHALTLPDDARCALSAIAVKHSTEGLTYPTEDIARVQTPTLIVGGKLDRVAILARTYGYLELLPNSWGFVLPHCGHWVMLEAPAEFVSVTLSFLAEGQFEAR